MAAAPQFVTTVKRCCGKLQGVDFIVLSFVVAPAIRLLFFSLVFGRILSAVENWSYSDGFWYVSANMAGMPNPFVTKTPVTTHGMLWDMAISLLAMVFGSTVVGLAGMLAFVSDLPEKLQLGSLRRGLLALFVGVPIGICVACALTGIFMAWAEEWTFWEAFRFTMGTTCGLGTPLTAVNPTEYSGRLLAVVCGMFSQGLVGVISGITGGVGVIAAGVDRFSAAFATRTPLPIETSKLPVKREDIVRGRDVPGDASLDLHDGGNGMSKNPSLTPSARVSPEAKGAGSTF